MAKPRIEREIKHRKEKESQKMRSKREKTYSGKQSRKRRWQSSWTSHPIYSDFLRSVQVLSSVTTNSELTSGYNVRGGSFDENLIYLNGYEIDVTKEGAFAANNVLLPFDGSNELLLTAYDKVGNFTDYKIEIIFPSQWNSQLQDQEAQKQ